MIVLRDALRDIRFANDRAVILGKGPSFSRWEQDKDKYPGALICGINQASNATEVDLAICAHVEPAMELKRQKMLLMPYKPIFGWDSQSFHPLSDYKELLESQEVYGYNVYWQGPEKFSDSPVISGEGTTAHHLVDILARLGIKEFIFYGVDGGKKVYGKQYYAEGFKLDDKKIFEGGKIPTDFDAFFSFFFRLRRKHGLKLTWI
jgi:hypothetical protein